MSKLDKVLGIGTLLTAAWRKVKDWRAAQKLAREKAKAARTERELQAIHDLAEEARRKRDGQ